MCETNLNWEWDSPPNAAPRIMDFTGQKAGQAIIYGLRGGTAVDTGSPYVDMGDGATRINKYVKQQIESLSLALGVKKMEILKRFVILFFHRLQGQIIFM